MSGVRVEVGVDDRQFQAAMVELLARGRALEPAFKSIGEMMLRSTDQRFRDQVDQEGAPWLPISAAWRDEKQRRGHIQKILQMRGRLRGSVTYKASNDRVAVGSNVIYAAIHQLGGDINQPERTQVLAFQGPATKPGRFISRAKAGKAKKAVTIRIATIKARTISMPARPYLGLSADDRERVAKILARHLRGER